MQKYWLVIITAGKKCQYIWREAWILIEEKHRHIWKYDIQFHEFFCALGIFARKCGCTPRITIFLDRLRMCTVFCFARVARVYTCEYIEIFPGAKLVILVRAILYLIKWKSHHKALTYLLTFILLQEAFSILEFTYLVMCRVQPKIGLGLGPVESGWVTKRITTKNLMIMHHS